MKNKPIHVALAGNPNAGKTSAFNCLVGANQRVGNFSGVTVEKVEGIVKHRQNDIRIVDLPGTYSFSPYSPEEKVARDYILEEKPDMVVHIVDATNLERNLVLTTQIMDLGVEFLIVLNMMDEVEKQGIQIDIPQIEQLFGAHVIPFSALEKEGTETLLDHIVDLYNGDIHTHKNKHPYSPKIEEYIEELQTLIERRKDLNNISSRWLALKLIELDKDVYQSMQADPLWVDIQPVLHHIIDTIRKHSHSEPDVFLAEKRVAFVHGAIKETVQIDQDEPETVTEKIDNVLLHKVLGLPIFLFIMYGIFQLTFRAGEYPMMWIESFFNLISGSLDSLLADSMFKSILIDGILAGVGGVLVFLPVILILFFCIALLEATGYMARVAFVMDRVMHRIGLHGKSFIPMMTGFGCSVPAMMATRTLRNRSDRLTTMMIIPFFSCSAKLPTYTVILSAFFLPAIAGNILFGVYIFGILIAFLSAKLIKKTAFDDESEPFVMELPPYRMPSWNSMMHQTWMRAVMYLKKAGTVILIASVIIWFAGTYPKNDNVTQKYDQLRLQAPGIEQIDQIDRQEQAEQLPYSVAGRIGKALEPISKPLGFDWRLNIALINGVAAKEIVVSTMGTIYAMGGHDKDMTLAESLRTDPAYSPATGLSFMIFVLLYIPCVATVAVFSKESGSRKWTFIFVTYTILVAWISSFIVFQTAALFGL